MTALAINE